MSRPPTRPLTTALGWPLPGWLLDVGPVVVIVLEGVAAIALRPKPGSSAVALSVGLAIVAVALLLRHRSPLIVLGAVLAVAFALDYGGIVMLPVLLAIFTVAEYVERTRLVAAAVVAALVVIFAPAAHDHALQTLSQILSRLVAVGLAVAVGLYLRARADYVIGLHERAERLERERELLAQQAVADERLRIARELHDVVAHNVSLMVVQAQALAATSAGAGSAERDLTLGRVADLGREALSEMHRMLGVLRLQDGELPTREPQPGVRDLKRLIDRTCQSGLETRLVVQGQPRELPPGVDLSAYRIVQEALTNVIRHAAADHALVTLAYGEESLAVTVVDNGTGSEIAAGRAYPSAGGHGMVGMRERVALFGGELAAGRRRDGAGYRVHASIPVR